MKVWKNLSFLFVLLQRKVWVLPLPYLLTPMETNFRLAGSIWPLFLCNCTHSQNSQTYTVIKLFGKMFWLLLFNIDMYTHTHAHFGINCWQAGFFCLSLGIYVCTYTRQSTHMHTHTMGNNPPVHVGALARPGIFLFKEQTTHSSDRTMMAVLRKISCGCS